MNILYLEDDFINAEQSKNIINFYNNHLTKTFVYGSSYPLNILNEYKDSFGTFSLSILKKNDELYGISKYQRKAIENGGKIHLLTL